MSTDAKPEVEPFKHTAKPIGAATQRWMERRLGQKRLPLDEEPCRAAIREGIERRSAEFAANDNAGAK